MIGTIVRSGPARTLATTLAVLLAQPGTALAQDGSGPARFDYVAYHGLDLPAAPPEGQYRNPVLPGFHPDPSIVRVGDDFYAVTSTFSWFPGLPIFHSRDLVNWRQVGNAIDRTGMMDFTGLGTNRGLFAPAITHHGGKFWIVNTCIDCGSNFVITATDPAGPWSEPSWLDFGGIDPSLYFEGDRAWIVYNDAPPGEPMYEGHRALWMQEFDIAAMQVKPGRTLLVNGGVDLSEQPVWAEGPHIYKVDGWYYLLAAEGGTADQHSQTIYRSRKVDGPYVPGPINPILTQRDLPTGRPDRVEATGHADLVKLDDGSWWGVFLATRPFAGQSTLLGRETFLLPVRWEDGWPRFLDPGEAVPSLVDKPNLAAGPGETWSSWREEFDAPLGMEWLTIRNPVAPSPIETSGSALTIAPRAVAPGSLGQPAFTGRRMRHHAASFETAVEFDPAREGDGAGLLAFMDEGHFVSLALERMDDAPRVVLRRRIDPDHSERGEALAMSQPLAPTDALHLRMRFNGGTARFSWREEGSAVWRNIGGTTDVEPLASIHAGLFTGLVVGPYAMEATAP